MKFTQIPASTFENLQLNAGILVDDFDPTTLEVGNLLGATSGGINFQDSVQYSDFGDGIDNCPRNMKELKHVDYHDVTMGGTFVSVAIETAKILAGAAGIENDIKVVPRNDLTNTDFKEIWWIGDYSDENEGDTAGFIAIRLMNALNTGGFRIQSTDKGKGQFAFTFTGHYSINAQDVVPYEAYIKEGSASVKPSIYLNAHGIELVEGQTFKLIPEVVPASSTITWTTGDSSVATINSSTGVVTAEDAGNTIITAAITVSGATYNDTCTVVVTAAGA